ncbi:MAG: hypothetical protein Q4C74_09085 [Rothia sp. (in: high G+C Gram-positive bacteria)]|nr:hypothetical protein [Rothia sp. (in: high G+C Gram-positive bacteria)]
MSLTLDERRERFIRGLKNDMERGYQDSVLRAQELEDRRKNLAKETKQTKVKTFFMTGKK